MLSERGNLNISMVVKGKKLSNPSDGEFLLFLCRNLVKRRAEGLIKYKKGHFMYFKVQQGPDLIYLRRTNWKGEIFFGQWTPPRLTQLCENIHSLELCENIQNTELEFEICGLCSLCKHILRYLYSRFGHFGHFS